MTVESSVLTNYTTMSLDARFTQLRRQDTRLPTVGMADLRQQFASAKSRRLALQMSRRPSVQAALTFKRNMGGGAQRGRGGGRGGMRNIGRNRRNSFSDGNSQRRGRSSSVGRGRRSSSVGRGRSSSVGRLSRSQSLQSLVGSPNATSPFRNGFRGRGRGGRRGGRGQARGGGGGFRPALIANGGGGGGRVFRGRIQRRSDNFGQRRGRGGFNTNRGGRGRGRGGNFRRGRGAAAGRGGRSFGQQGGGPPSKEKLDQELDEYMSLSKTKLDKDIDTYMSQTQ